MTDPEVNEGAYVLSVACFMYASWTFGRFADPAGVLSLPLWAEEPKGKDLLNMLRLGSSVALLVMIVAGFINGEWWHPFAALAIGMFTGIFGIRLGLAFVALPIAVVSALSYFVSAA
jgi:hypothetical protein